MAAWGTVCVPHVLFLPLGVEQAIPPGIENWYGLPCRAIGRVGNGCELGAEGKVIATQRAPKLR